VPAGAAVVFWVSMQTLLPGRRRGGAAVVVGRAFEYTSGLLADRFGRLSDRLGARPWRQNTLARARMTAITYTT
jgi:hypothetical protein